MTIQLRSAEEQLAFNLKRWPSLISDPELKRINQRIETDRFGRVVVLGPIPGIHGWRGAQVLGRLFENAGSGGRSYGAVGVSTADGIKTIDCSWMSHARFAEQDGNLFFFKAPEVCVEIVLPVDIPEEINERVVLYFDAGAEEVWLCEADSGKMIFHMGKRGNTQPRSVCFPEFPAVLED